MKKILAIAVVVLLSLSSLADLVEDNKSNLEEKSNLEGEGSKPLPQATKRQSVQPLTKDGPVKLSQKSCPSEFFVRFEDKDIGDFCISKDLQDEEKYVVANERCRANGEINGRRFQICSKEQLVSACNKKENFVRTPAKTLTLMFGYEKGSLYIGGADCKVEAFGNGGEDLSHKFRCCVQL